MKKIKSLFLLLSCLPLLIQAQSYHDVKQEIDKIVYLDAQLDLYDIPNVMIGVVNGDSTFYYHYNFDKTKRVEIDEYSIFEIGDLSKAFTGMICYWLAQNGKINLSDTLIIKSNKEQKSKTYPASIEMILSHRSGLPLRPNNFGEQEDDIKNPYANYTKDELIAYFFQDNSIKSEQGVYLYSHYGYALLEIYLEQKLGYSFNQVVTQFLKEQGLSQTFLEREKEIKIVVGHNRAGDATTIGKFASFGSAEGFKSSAEDLLSIACKTWTNGDHWLSSSFSQYWKMPDSKKMKVSTGWYVQQPRKFSDVILQSGSSEGHRSFLGFVPATNTAVVVLSDSLDSHHGVGFLILRMLNQEWKRKVNVIDN